MGTTNGTRGGLPGRGAAVQALLGGGDRSRVASAAEASLMARPVLAGGRGVVEVALDDLAELVAQHLRGTPIPTTGLVGPTQHGGGVGIATLGAQASHFFDDRGGSSLLPAGVGRAWGAE